MAKNVNTLIKVSVIGNKELVQLRQNIQKYSEDLKELKKENAGVKDINKETARSFAENEAKLRAARAEYRKAQNDLKNMSKATQNAGGFTMKMAKAFGVAQLAVDGFKKVTGILANQVKDAVGTFKDFEFEMAKVKAISGANANEFRKLRESAEELGRSTFFTATQVAELQINFSKLGFTAQETLAAQEAALLTATATGEDLARTATVIGSTLRGFGLPATEASRAADVMAASFTSSALTLEKYQTSMTKVAPIAKLLGFSMEETTAIMGTLTDAGIEASIAGTSLRNIFLKLGDPSSDLAKSLGRTVNSGDELVKALVEMNEAGLDVESALSKVDQRQVAAFATMVKGAKTIERQTAAFEKSSGAAKEMASVIGDTLEGSILRFQSALDGLKIALIGEGTGFGNILKNASDGLAEFFNKIAEASTPKFSEQLEEDRKKLITYRIKLNDSNLSLDDRKGLLVKMKEEFPDYLKGIDAEKTSLEKLNTSLEKVNDSMINRILIEREQEEISEKQAELLDRRVDLHDQRRLVEEQITKVVDKFNLKLKENVTLEEQVRNLLEQRPAKYGRVLDSMTELGHRMSDYNTIQSNVNHLSNQENKLIQKKNDLLDELGIKQDLVIKQSGEDEGEGNGNGNGGSDANLSVFLPNAGQVFDRMKELEAIIKSEEARLQQEFLDGKIKSEAELQQKILDMKIKTYEEEINMIGMSSVAHEQATQKYLDLKIKQRNEERKIFNQAEDEYDKQQKTNKKLIEQENEKIATTILHAESAEAALAQLLSQKINEILLEAMASMFKDKTIPFIAKVGLGIGMKSLITPMINSLLGGDSKFERGGLTKGGMFNGASHANGGVKFAVGGRIMEAEGGEAIINKKSTAKFRPILSAINSYNGNGVKFADGGMISSGEKFAMGGELGNIQSMISAASGGSQRVVLVESDVTSTQNRISALESQATF